MTLMICAPMGSWLMDAGLPGTTLTTIPRVSIFIPNPSAKAQLPHARCACETHIFVPPPSGALRHSATKPKNKERCATCFCYVCAVWKSNSELG